MSMVFNFNYSYISFSWYFFCYCIIATITFKKLVLFTLDPTDDDKIMAEGIGRFCEDLKLDPANLRVLLIAWKFKAATQCEFTRKEFTDGMLELG